MPVLLMTFSMHWILLIMEALYKAKFKLWETLWEYGALSLCFWNLAAKFFFDLQYLLLHSKFDFYSFWVISLYFVISQGFYCILFLSWDLYNQSTNLQQNLNSCCLVYFLSRVLVLTLATPPFDAHFISHYSEKSSNGLVIKFKYHVKLNILFDTWE